MGIFAGEPYSYILAYDIYPEDIYMCFNEI